MASKYLMVSFKGKDAELLDQFLKAVPKGKRSPTIASLIRLEVAELERLAIAKRAQLEAEEKKAAEAPQAQGVTQQADGEVEKTG